MESPNVMKAKVSTKGSVVIPAAQIKTQYPISYADAFAVALAQELNAIIVTGDPEFKQVESIVTLFWL